MTTLTPPGEPLPPAALPVRWVERGWDDPAPAALRVAMDAEMSVRYAHVEDLFSALVMPPGTAWLTTWVALLGEEPVATATLRWLGEGPDRLAEVKKVYVAPAGRRRGLAAQALRQVEVSARRLGVGRLHLHTGDLQPEAIALYEREGWDRVPVFAPYDVLDVSVCFTKAVPPA
ncbi:GNAT family N-acetyltransferase [uncultured Pseudokineococcus sp.]|uniref:GNAT family N-acetyltransferase n=1 Tax=uncultured Pseudokineococcus sp. TaxID=1642928 RepID=UPI00262085EC|nr:GNAT family N-acetyltransferase [uncultured Pseudokineococcus sp.]